MTSCTTRYLVDLSPDIRLVFMQWRKWTVAFRGFKFEYVTSMSAECNSPSSAEKSWWKVQYHCAPWYFPFLLKIDEHFR